MEKWQIYAHAVRDFIKIQGGFGDCEQSVKEMFGMRKFLYGNVDKIEVNGKTFHWPPRHEEEAAQNAKK